MTAPNANLQSDPAPDARAERRAARQAEVIREGLAVARAAVDARRPADEALAAWFRRRRELGGRDRRLVSTAVFAWFRWRGWLAGLAEDEALHLACRLEAADELPQAIRRLAPAAPATPLGAGDLDARARAVAALRPPPAGDPEALLPPWVRDAVRGAPGLDAPGAWRRLRESLQRRPGPWIRDRGRGGRALLEALRRHDPGAAPHPALPTALGGTRALPLAALRADVGACFEVQDVASQAVGLVCDPAPGQRWWDACCGSGGKAIQLLDLMGSRGHLVATDLRATARRAFAQRARAAGLPADRLRILARDLSAPGPAPGAFDGVLVDAPCSGLGTWPRNPDMRWRTAPQDVEVAAAKQAAILEAAAAGVARGGRLVYAVCTLTRAETTEVVADFSARHPDLAPDPFPHPLTGAPAAGICLVQPWEGPGDGMFMARWRRT